MAHLPLDKSHQHTTIPHKIALSNLPNVALGYNIVEPVTAELDNVRGLCHNTKAVEITPRQSPLRVLLSTSHELMCHANVAPRNSSDIAGQPPSGVHSTRKYASQRSLLVCGNSLWFSGHDPRGRPTRQNGFATNIKKSSRNPLTTQRRSSILIKRRKQTKTAPMSECIASAASGP